MFSTTESELASEIALGPEHGLLAAELGLGSRAMALGVQLAGADTHGVGPPLETPAEGRARCVQRRAARRAATVREEATGELTGVNYEQMGRSYNLDKLEMVFAADLDTRLANMRCPITQEVPRDPAHTADGFVYERSAIANWIRLGNKTSPMTGAVLPSLRLTAAPTVLAEKSLLLASARQFRLHCKKNATQAAAWQCACSFVNRGGAASGELMARGVAAVAAEWHCRECHAPRRAAVRRRLEKCTGCGGFGVRRGPKAKGPWSDRPFHSVVASCGRKRCAPRVA